MASQGDRNWAFRSIQHKECENFLAAIPEEPLAQVIILGQLLNSLTALQNASASK
jgi:hypothetical protein